MRFSFVVNPVARSSLKIYKIFSKLVEEHGYTYETFYTERRGHARELVKSAKGDVIIVAGGDGTLNEVVNGIIDHKVEMPVAPIFGGTGCDVARSLDIKRKPVERFEEILRFNIKRVNPVLLKTSEGYRYFVGVSDLGFGAKVAYSFDGLRRFGRFGYAIGVLNTLYELKPLRVNMEIDGKYYEGDVIMVVFANSPYFGGGMKISPNSSITGPTKVIVIEYVPVYKFVYYFPRVYNGSHLRIKEIMEIDAKRLKVFTPNIPVECEGEFAGYTPAEYEVTEDKTVIFV
ncbi:MAG: diacylglycerol kinase family protein [candidate division WOR-3 bacterium]